MTVVWNWRVCCSKRFVVSSYMDPCSTSRQRLSGASLLVFKNKSDVSGAMTEDEVREVSSSGVQIRAVVRAMLTLHRASGWTR